MPTRVRQPPQPTRPQPPPIVEPDPDPEPMESDPESTSSLADASADDEDDNAETASPGQSEKVEEFNPAGLKEIGNLASWTVSTSKPGCGVEALRDEDVNLFWQSDGPQPHLLNIHFHKRVSIVALRLYLDWENDESYTPTKMSFHAGTGYHDLVQFLELSFAQPKGWIDVDLSGVGGGESGRVLRAWLVQVRVAENHQNGKDTHVRGLQIFAKEEGEKRVEELGKDVEDWDAFGDMEEELR